MLWGLSLGQVCPWLNGTHTALLAGRRPAQFRCAGRIQGSNASGEPWGQCQQSCVEEARVAELETFVQAAQAAQIGYSTKHASERRLVYISAVNLLMDMRHAAMSAKNRSAAQVSRRHAQRIVADCFVHGIVWGPVETENLNMNAMASKQVKLQGSAFNNFVLRFCLRQHSCKILEALSEPLYEFARYWKVKRRRRVLQFPEPVAFPGVSRRLGCKQW